MRIKDLILKINTKARQDIDNLQKEQRAAKELEEASATMTVTQSSVEGLPRAETKINQSTEEFQQLAQEIN